MIILTAWLAFAAPAPAAPPVPVPVVNAVQSYEELVAEYEAAVKSWKYELAKSKDKAERKRIRAERPAKLYAQRFEALAALGEGRALVWQLDNIRYVDVAAKARDAKRTEWYTTLFDKHAAEPWFGDALTQLWSDRKRVESKQLAAWLESARDKNESTEVQAQSRYYLAYDLARSESKELREQGFAALEALAKDLPDTSWAARARQDVFIMRDRIVGRPAIDFTAKTVDGESFKLSDYRGKVVLLDFWGFW